MISRRTALSLVQFLGLQDRMYVGIMIEKHRLPYSGQIACTEGYAMPFLDALSQSMAEATDGQIYSILDEVARTKRDLRARVTPHYRYEERLSDLERCLLLDGYMIDDGQIVPLDPTVLETPPVEDDLTRALNACGLPGAGLVIEKFQDSAEAFRRSIPNLNASLNDARVALETLAKAIANARLLRHPGNVDQRKWGSVLTYLRQTKFLTDEEERGLAAVFGFVSPGSHIPLGLSELEMARLGRNFAAGMCWFLAKRFLAERAVVT